MKFDKIDKKILDIVQNNSNITNALLASEVGISPPGMLERVKRLENSGIILKSVALVDHEKVGKGTMALVSITLSKHGSDPVKIFTDEIEKLDEVLECFHTTGDADFLLKVVVKDIKEYENFALKKLNNIKVIDRIKTTFVLSVMKYSTKVRIEG